MLTNYLGKKKSLAFVLGVLLVVNLLTAAVSANGKVITLGDGGWASLSFETSVAKYIIENGYHYKTELVSGNEEVIQNKLETGNLDIIMEFWMYDQNRHDNAKKAGIILDVRPIFMQTDGLWVPAYVVKGDPRRGIKAVAPGLITLNDLKKYTKVFQDPNDPSQGVIQLGVDGWTANDDMVKRLNNYDIASAYNYKTLKAEAELAGNVEAKIKKGEPIVFFDYMPAALLGKYDFIHLEDPVREQKAPGIVWISASTDLSKKAPDVYTFLVRYQLDLTVINKQLAYIENNNLKFDDAAKEFLKQNPDIWKKWVTDAAAEKIEETLNR